MDCKKCGHELPGESQRCPHCGTPVPEQGGIQVALEVGTVQQGGTVVGAVYNQHITINVTWQAAPFCLDEPDLVRLRADYLSYLREAYQYLDFKGVPQVERIAQQLPLDAVYVPLRARPERPEGETWFRIAGREWSGDGPSFADQGLPDVEQALLAREQAALAEPVAIDQALGQAPALVILGDPGAGKSTLLKVLALALARQADGPLPILLPLNAYAAALEQGEVSLGEFMGRYYGTRQQRLVGIAPLLEAALDAGQAVVLLDGLDEVQARRGFLVRLVQDFCRELIPAPGRADEVVRGNRLVVTSRIVGYRDAPLDGARWRTYTLVDFRPDEIERFVGRWTLAFEVATHGETELARQAAARERDELLAAIRGRPSIERLASNPLLLTILALIKRQGVKLPDRRVELYELYLRTLIHSWNQARSLDRRPVGPELDYLETVQVLAPLGLWLRESNPTAGLVGQRELLAWLARHFTREWDLPRGEAQQRARLFLDGVHHYSNLLVERGRAQYGFLHLTFEEMLAAKGIAALAQEGAHVAAAAILRHMAEPAWHETIMLSIGALGIVGQQSLVAGLVLQALCREQAAGEERGRNVILAGESLLDVGAVGVGRKAAASVTACLVETMQDAEVSPKLQRQAGLVLGRLGWQPEDLETWVEMRPGSFLYGNHKMEREIKHRFWMGRYPVTNVQYARFVEGGGYGERRWWSEKGWAWRAGTYDSKASDSVLRWLEQRSPERRDLPYYWTDPEWNNPIFPAVGVCWFEAQAYCNWLAEQMRSTTTALPLPHGYSVRLPTEDEWERAVRGTEGNAYPWGDEFDQRRANTWEDGSRNTSAVCTYPQGVNDAGLWDGAGNVWEWTATWHDRDRDARVLRGGSWYNPRRSARCAARGRGNPDFWVNFIGFRVCVSLSFSEF